MNISKMVYMKTEVKILIFLIILMIINIHTSIKHSKYIQRNIDSVISNCKTEFIGIGVTRKLFKPRSMVILSTTSKGIITECRIMSGVTVFSKFKLHEELSGIHFKNIPNMYMKKKYREALQQSIDLITKEYQNC